MLSSVFNPKIKAFPPKFCLNSETEGLIFREYILKLEFLLLVIENFL